MRSPAQCPPAGDAPAPRGTPTVPRLLLAALLASGCASAGSGRGGDPGDGGRGAGRSDAGGELPSGDEDAGISCPEGTHEAGGRCVPDQVTCAAEFPCPQGEECIGARCVKRPGPCMTHNDCPSGFLCVNGNCEPLCPGRPECRVDADCGANRLCVLCACVAIDMCIKPSPDVAGTPWAATQHLNLREALTSFQQSFIGIMKKLRDGVLGCPRGSSGDCPLYQLIALTLPSWARSLIVGLGNFGDVLSNDNFKIQSTMSFVRNNRPQGYDGKDQWRMLTFVYQNMTINRRPEDVPQIGRPVILDFPASAVCGVLYIEKHEVKGVLSGILRWILDTVVEITTCANRGPCFKNLGDALDAAIDCNKVQDLGARALCFGFRQGLKQKINDAIDSWLLQYSLMTLKGTARINDSGRSLDDGKWDGTLGDGGGIFKNFTGTFTAKR